MSPFFAPPTAPPRMFLIYKKSDLSIVNVVAGNIISNGQVEDYGYSSQEYAIYDKIPPGYVHHASNYVLKQLPGRVALLLRPYFLQLVAVSGCEIIMGADYHVVPTYQANIPVGQECVFRVEKRDTTRRQIVPGTEKIKIAIPLGVPVISPNPPVLQLVNGVGEVKIGAFEFPATLEGHIYPLENVEDIIDCRLFKHFILKK